MDAADLPNPKGDQWLAAVRELRTSRLIDSSTKQGYRLKLSTGRP